MVIIILSVILLAVLIFLFFYRLSYGKKMASQEKQIERLQLLADRYRTMIDRSAEIVFEHDLEGKVLWANQTFCTLIGYPEKVIVQKYFRELLDGNYLMDWDVYKQNLMQQDAFSGQFHLKLADGLMQTFQYRSKVYRKNDLPFKACVLGFKDAEELRQSHLQEGKAALTNLFPFAVLLLDEQYNFKVINRNFLQRIGYASAELYKKNFAEILTPSSKRLLWKIRSDRDEEALPLNVRLKDGNEAAFTFHLLRIQNRFGKITEYFLYEESVSPEWITHNGKDKIRNPLKLSRELTTHFVHEIKNIFSAILGFANLSMEELAPQNLSVENLQEIKTSVDRGLEFVNRILDLQGNGIHLHKIAVEEMLSIISDVFTDIKIESLRPEYNPYYLLVNRSRLNSLFGNIFTTIRKVVNRKATNNVRLMLATEETADAVNEGEVRRQLVVHLLLSMQEWAEKEKNSWKRDLKKTYDYYLAQTLIEKCGGSLAFKEKGEREAEILLHLPFFKREIQPGLPKNDKKGHVLFLDDDQALVKMNNKLLLNLGYQVSAFTEANAALKDFKEHPATFDVVLTDFMMPSMNGFEFAREIKKISAKIPIILFSGKTETHPGNDSRKDLVFAILEKPVDVNLLKKTIEQARVKPTNQRNFYG